MINYLGQLVQAEKHYRHAQQAVLTHASEIFRVGRMELGLTQRDLAAKLGVHYTYISKIENGAVMPGQPTILKFRDLLTQNAK